MGTHEEYVECLEVLEYEEELKQAHISYQQQMERKLTFDSKIKSWKLEAMERESHIHERLTGVGVTQVDPLVQVLSHWP